MKTFSTRKLALMAMLSAVSIILSRLLGFYITDSLRVSFEYFPISLAGLCFGPLAGTIVGGISDFLGALMFSGRGFFPQLIAGPCLAGFLAGVLAKFWMKGDYSWVKVTLTVVVAELIGNLLCGTYVLSLTFGMPFLPNLALRTPFKLAIIAVDSQLTFVTVRAIRPLLRPKPPRAS